MTGKDAIRELEQLRESLPGHIDLLVFVEVRIALARRLLHQVGTMAGARERAVQVLEEARGRADPDSSFVEWARSSKELGLALLAAPESGERAGGPQAGLAVLGSVVHGGDPGDEPEARIAWWSVAQQLVRICEERAASGDPEALREGICARRRMLEVGRVGEDGAIRAETWNNLAVALGRCSGDDRLERMGEGVVAYVTALEEGYHPGDDTGAWARVQNNLVLARLQLAEETGDPAPREAAVDQCRDLVNSQWLADRPADRASFMLHLSNPACGLALDEQATWADRGALLLEQALASDTEQGGSSARLRSHLAVSLLNRPQRSSGQLERAISLFEEALAADDDPRIRINLAQALAIRTSGDPAVHVERALAQLDRVVRQLARPGTQAEVTDKVDALIAMGLVLLEARRELRGDDQERAVEVLGEALNLARLSGVRSDRVARAAGNLGVALQRRHPGRALRSSSEARAVVLLQEALAIRRRSGSPAAVVVASNLARSYQHLGGEDNVVAARSLLEGALASAGPALPPRQWAWLHAGLGTALLELPDPDPLRAEACLVEAVRSGRGQLSDLRLVKVLRDLGQVRIDAGRWVEAAETLLEAVSYLAERERELSSPQGLQQLMDSDVASTAAGVLLRLGRLAECTAVLELTSARSVVATMAMWRAAASAGAESNSSKAVELLRRWSLAQCMGTSLPTFARAGAAAAGRPNASSPAVTALRRVADAARAIAEREGRPLVWMACDGQGTHIVLAPPDIGSPLVGVFCPEWRDPNWSGLRLDHPLGHRYAGGVFFGNTGWLVQGLPELMGELRRTLLDPLAVALAGMGARSAVLIPYAALGALPLASAAPFGLDLQFAPSAAALGEAQLSLSARRHDPALLVAIADTNDRSPLPAARAEAISAIGALGQSAGRLLFGGAATLEALSAAVVGASHLHFACHGHFDSDDPLGSGLQLADGEFLTARDLLAGALDLSRLRLVVLSVCQSSVADPVRAPAELTGLVAALLQRGVPTVIACAWPVDDLASWAFMGRFYDLHLGRGQSAGSALSSARWYTRTARAAELAAKARVQPGLGYSAAWDRWIAAWEGTPEARPFEHPINWAGYRLNGTDPACWS